MLRCTQLPKLGDSTKSLTMLKLECVARDDANPFHQILSKLPRD